MKSLRDKTIMNILSKRILYLLVNGSANDLRQSTLINLIEKEKKIDNNIIFLFNFLYSFSSMPSRWTHSGVKFNPWQVGPFEH